MNLIRAHALLIAAFAAFLSIGAGVQDSKSPPVSGESNFPQPEWVKLYSREQGASAPVLIQLAGNFENDCKGLKRGGSVKFSFVVDSSGLPRNVVFERALANEIDLIALKLMLMSRFHPAMLDGNPVAVGRSVEMRLQVCDEQTKDSSGQVRGSSRLRSLPEEEFKEWEHSPDRANLAPDPMPHGLLANRGKINGLTPPKQLARPELPNLRGHSGSLFVEGFVDEHGIPQELKPVKHTDDELLPVFLQFFRNVRYQPAMKDGMPVPCHFTESLGFMN